jgi:hypothetical protein
MTSRMKSAPALCVLAAALAASTASAAPCQVHPVQFEGWSAQQMSNDWLQLTFVPQLGGRLMQVAFNGHPYLFVNPVYKGKYISPAEAAGRWINYGGDKIWPLPEGNDDEQHWQGASTPLDDGAYAFSVLSQDSRCTVRLEGPPDPPTGLQYTREISIGSESPEISFHAITKNYTGHSITWAVQSVSQYNLSDANDTKEYNHKFWAITPVNPGSSYLLGYHVRDGLANDPSFSVQNGLVGKPLAAHRRADKIELSGTFGVFFPGELKAFLYGDGGMQVGQTSLLAVQPQDLVTLHQSIAAPANVERVSIHVIDRGGVDRGALGEVFVTINEEGH